MGVPPTQVTLIARLRNPSDQEAWTRFETLYRELIVRFTVRQGVQPADAEDIAQAVFRSLTVSMPQFRLDPTKGRFRSYLFRAVRNEISRVRRSSKCPTHGRESLTHAGELIGSNAARCGDLGADDSLERMFEDEWINHHFRLALAQVRQTFTSRSVEMFERLMAGDSLNTVALKFDTTPVVVQKVKQRVRDRMKELIARQIAEEA